MILCLLLLIQVFTSAKCENLVVSTKSGDILGSTLKTRLGKTIYAFRGVRYAEPPIKDLRFKNPEPIKKWNGIFNATIDGPACPQPIDEPISEDCLRLNIYTTKLPQNQNSNIKRPVIVYIHTGSFFIGSGRSTTAGPHYFLDQKIVLVTINYRLATLGFLSIGKLAPGNFGLKDQVMALKWIQENIEYFGGDPKSVTLFGYSAGSWSITMHLVSPMSRGLFDKVILGSGSILGQWPLKNNQTEIARKQAKFVGCPENNLEDLYSCLKNVPAEVLGNSLPEFQEFGYDPVVVWFPTIEEDFGQERFLTEHPIKFFERGDFAKVPILMGITRDELANRSFHFVISAPVNRAANMISEKTTAPIYFYEFSYKSPFSYFYLPNQPKKIPYGVVHQDDLIYLFYISTLFPFFYNSYPESEMVEKLTLLWANFAKTGNPVPEKYNWILEGLKWDTFNSSSRKYLEIGKSFSLRANLNRERYDFWDKLFPISSFP